MKNKSRGRITVTVGISAFNEENNIQNLLRGILMQKTKDFELKEIIVISDASTDNTAGKVREIKDRRIILLEEKERVGQNTRQNSIFKTAKGDIIVLLEADTILKDNIYLYELIHPFINEKNISMTYGSSFPISLGREVFFERMLTFVETLKQEKLQALNHGSLYLCGTGRAFSKEMSSVFSWPKDVPEDTYSFLFCKQNGLKMVFTPNAVTHYRSPANFSDYAKKAIRFNKGRNNLKKYFPESLLIDSYRLQNQWMFSLFLEGFYKMPTFMIAYIFFNIAKRLFSLFSPEFNPLWEVSNSTKVLE